MLGWLLAVDCNRFLPLAYGGKTHAIAAWDFEKWILEVSKSYPPLIALGVLTGIVLDHLLDLFLSNFFVFCEKSGFTGSSPTLADL